VGEVLVEARDQAGAAHVSAGYQRLEAEDLDRVPTPGLSADLASYMTTQPGVVSLGDRGGGLYIRGGEPSQNRVYVDRIPVFQPFHMLGFYSAIPARIVRQTDVYAGGYPASYSGGLSSVIDVSAQAGHMSRYGGEATVSPFISSIAVDGPLLEKELSFLGSYRTSTLGPGASRYVDQSLPFTFDDGFAKFYWRASPTERLIGAGIWSRDRGRLGATPEDSIRQRIEWSNYGGSLRYLFIPSELAMTGELFLAYAGMRSSNGSPFAPTRTSDLSVLRVGARGSFPSTHISADAGFTADLVGVDTELRDLFQNVESRAALTLEQVGLFVSPQFSIPWAGEWTIEPGLRTQFYNLRVDPLVEPRLRISFSRGWHELTFAGGLFHQELVGLSDRRDAASVFTAWTAVLSSGQVPSLSPLEEQRLDDVLFERLGRALHAASTYRIQPSPHLEIALSGYARRYSNLFVQRWTSLAQFSTKLEPARGRSYGGSVRVEAQKGPFYGFVNYGYSNTRYTAEDARFRLWYGNENLSFRPPHDQRHRVNALGEVSRWGFTLGTRWSFATGRPFSRPIGFDGFVFMDGIQNQFTTDGEARVIYEEPYNALLPAYHRLDVSLERTFELGTRGELTAKASVINAYNRANIFYINVFTARRQDQLPIVPTLGVRLAIGP
jgi:hypothetical protein